MYKEELKSYYKRGLTTSNLADIMGIRWSYMSAHMKRLGMLTYNDWLKELDFEEVLRKRLAAKYVAITRRCSKGISSNYEGLEYLNIIEWVELCNENKGIINGLWDDYTKSGNQLKLALSVDRIDIKKGYTKDNLQFISHGYNSWKDNLNPHKVVKNDATYYVMSLMEAQRATGALPTSLRYYRDGLGKSRGDEYIVEYSTVENVLKFNECSDIKEYYDKHIATKE